MIPMPTTRRAVLCGCSMLTTAAFFASARRTAAQSVLPASPAPKAAAPVAPLKNCAPLARQPYRLLPAGSIKPSGWLRRQMEIQAKGLTGHIGEFWPDLGPNSGWLGGSGESWERGPYYLDGLLPLAWQLDDGALKSRAQAFIEWTLDHPWDNGNIGPKTNDDWWPRMVILKVLIQYHDLTGDPRVVPFMTNYFRYQLANLPGRPLRDWGHMRWQDNLVSVIWLYNVTGDAWLLDLAKLLKAQGFDWQGMFADFRFKEKVTPASIGIDEKLRTEDPATQKDTALRVHGVNNAQALKAAPVWSLISDSDADRDFIHHQLDMLDTYHGLPIGIFSADEHLAGRSPSQGVELCAIVESMYSLEYAMAVTGDAALGDRIEKLAYNALPGTFDDAMWAHQYDQQPNQVQVSVAKGPWTTNSAESNLFGLEPHFGCCTANYHQGWPKLTSSLWMASDDDGLAAAVYAPCTVTTQVRGVAVILDEQTDYPFRHSLKIRVTPAAPLVFPMSFRIPAWATHADIRVNGKPVAAAAAGSFARVERQWTAGDEVRIAFESTPHAVAGFNHSVSFEDGPLVFSLPIDEQWKKLRQHGPTADWEIFPQSPWAYAAKSDIKIKRVERAIGDVPFSRRSPPVLLVVEGQGVKDWGLVDGSADILPADLSGRLSGKREALVLMPYAAPKLRLTSFPSFTS